MPILFRPSILRSSSPFTRTFSTTTRLQIAKMTIVGRLAADSETVPTSTGDDIVLYTLGTSSGTPENRQTSWWKVACMEKDGIGREKAARLTKGTLVYLEGNARMRKYETKDGRTENGLNITQRVLQILKRPETTESEQDLGHDSIQVEE